MHVQNGVQGPRKGGEQGHRGRDGDASTPAMPSMSGTAAASTYASQPHSRSLSGRGASSSSASGSGKSGSHHQGGVDHISGLLVLGAAVCVPTLDMCYCLAREYACCFYNCRLTATPLFTLAFSCGFNWQQMHALCLVSCSL